MKGGVISKSEALNQVYTVYLGGQVAAMIDSLLNTIGRFHPLLVHLPIGLILFSFIISLLNEKQRASFEKAWLLCSYLVAFFSLLSLLTGFCLSQNGDYEASLVTQHQWSAIFCSVSSISVLVFKSQKRLLTWLNTLLIIVTGHLGGTLTHGELFGEESTTNTLDSVLVNEPVIVKNTGDTANKSVSNQEISSYEFQVRPILEEKCYSCHSALKKKGGLRLDFKTFIMIGGRNGTILHAGHPEISKLYKYLVLPNSDEMHMPPRGKRQMSAGEIAVIKTWIQAGALFENKSAHLLSGVDSTTIPIVAITTSKTPTIVHSTDESPSDVDASSFEELRTQGITVSKSPYTGSGLSVSFVNFGNIGQKELFLLEAHASSIEELDLSNHPLQVVDIMNTLKKLKNLKVLKLGNTGINPEQLKGLAHLKKLEVLNLFGNPLTDEVAGELLQSPNLKRVYLWKTQLSEATIHQLTRSMKATQFLGNNLQLIKQDSNINKK